MPLTERLRTLLWKVHHYFQAVDAAEQIDEARRNVESSSELKDILTLASNAAYDSEELTFQELKKAYQDAILGGWQPYEQTLRFVETSE